LLLQSGVIASDGREIVFAGAGILWGATTFFRGLHFTKGQKNSADRLSLAIGFILVIACTSYLTWSLLDSKH
jgi:hypothetical protein